MNSTNLFDYAMNEREEHDTIVSCVRRLRRTMETVAVKLSKAVAEETESKPRKAHRQSKERAIKDLVKHYLTEMRLSGEF
jgi:hypothetical protein